MSILPMITIARETTQGSSRSKLELKKFNKIVTEKIKLKSGNVIRIYNIQLTSEYSGKEIPIIDDINTHVTGWLIPALLKFLTIENVDIRTYSDRILTFENPPTDADVNEWLGDDATRNRSEVTTIRELVGVMRDNTRELDGVLDDGILLFNRELLKYINCRLSINHIIGHVYIRNLTPIVIPDNSETVDYDQFYDTYKLIGVRRDGFLELDQSKFMDLIRNAPDNGVVYYMDDWDDSETLEIPIRVVVPELITIGTHIPRNISDTFDSISKIFDHPDQLSKIPGIFDAMNAVVGNGLVRHNVRALPPGSAKCVVNIVDIEPLKSAIELSGLPLDEVKLILNWRTLHQEFPNYVAVHINFVHRSTMRDVLVPGVVYPRIEPYGLYRRL